MICKLGIHDVYWIAYTMDSGAMFNGYRCKKCKCAWNYDEYLPKPRRIINKILAVRDTLSYLVKEIFS